MSNYLLKEDSSYLLQETGDKLVLDSLFLQSIAGLLSFTGVIAKATKYILYKIVSVSIKAGKSIIDNLKLKKVKF